MPDATRSQYSLSVRLCTESFANSSTHFLSIFRSLKYQGLMGPYFRAKWNSRKKSYTTGQRLHGHFMDQFTNAERATDWRGNNMAQAIYEQMHQATGDIPLWMVVSAGTGGTATTIGRHIRY